MAVQRKNSIVNSAFDDAPFGRGLGGGVVVRHELKSSVREQWGR